jgi:hemerythrin-like domain-containing protein
MIRLPDPEKYEDPIRYFRDSHGVVGSVVDRFEKLLNGARVDGISKSFASTEEWSELLQFFVHAAPIHERDEEKALFPLVIEKVPHLGFQAKGSPTRFIHDQHEAMQERSKALLALWKAALSQKTLTPEDEQNFVRTGTELVALYREHISLENGIIYTTANDNLLSPVERIAIMMLVREQHSEKTVMPVLGFSDSPYEDAQEEDSADAIADDVIDSEEGDEEEEDQN